MTEGDKATESNKQRIALVGDGAASKAVVKLLALGLDVVISQHPHVPDYPMDFYARPIKIEPIRPHPQFNKRDIYRKRNKGR